MRREFKTSKINKIASWHTTRSVSWKVTSSWASAITSCTHSLLSHSLNKWSRWEILIDALLENHTREIALECGSWFSLTSALVSTCQSVSTTSCSRCRDKSRNSHRKTSLIWRRQCPKLFRTSRRISRRKTSDSGKRLWTSNSFSIDHKNALPSWMRLQRKTLLNTSTSFSSPRNREDSTSSLLVNNMPRSKRSNTTKARTSKCTRRSSREKSTKEHSSGSKLTPSTTKITWRVLSLSGEKMMFQSRSRKIWATCILVPCQRSWLNRSKRGNHRFKNPPKARKRRTILPNLANSNL